MRRTCTFDEVALVPQFNNIPSRTESAAAGTWCWPSPPARAP